MIGSCVATLVVTFAVWYMEKREHRKSVARYDGNEKQEADADAESVQSVRIIEGNEKMGSSNNVV